MFQLAIGMPGGIEWVWIGLVVVLLFGARKLPELARSMGSSINQFKKGLREEESAEQISEGSATDGSAKE